MRFVFNYLSFLFPVDCIAHIPVIFMRFCVHNCCVFRAFILFRWIGGEWTDPSILLIPVQVLLPEHGCFPCFQTMVLATRGSRTYQNFGFCDPRGFKRFHNNWFSKPGLSIVTTTVVAIAQCFNRCNINGFRSPGLSTVSKTVVSTTLNGTKRWARLLWFF